MGWEVEKEGRGRKRKGERTKEGEVQRARRAMHD